MTTFFAPERCDADGFMIRSYFPGDGAAMCAAINASYEHLRPWMCWVTPEETVDGCEARARRFRANLLLNTDFTLGLWSPDGSRLLGGTGFHLRDGSSVESQVAEIGMWISGPETGQGLGTRALQAMLTRGFS